MLPVPLDKIDAAYLLGLPDSGAPAESRTVDYKLDFTRNSRRQIEGSELRADVSAFANSEGGDLVIGVDEVAGEPVGVAGIACPNPDALKVQLDGILKSIEPRLTSYQIHPVTIAADRAVVVIRIRASFAAPHRTGQTGGFHYRTNSGKDAMSVDQVREAFVASAGLEGRLSTFRRDRLHFAGVSDPYRLASGARVVVHVLPLLGATRPGILDIAKRRSLLASVGVHRFSHDSPDARLNFDGLHLSYADQDGGQDGYSLWFRSGFHEVAWIEGEEVNPLPSSYDALRFADAGNDGSQAYWAIDEIAMGRAIFNAVRDSLSVYSEVEIPPPYFVGVSLLNCRNYELGAYHPARRIIRKHRGGRPLDRDALVIPEVVAEDSAADVKTLLHPVFTHIANSFGLSAANSYE